MAEGVQEHHPRGQGCQRGPHQRKGVGPEKVWEPHRVLLCQQPAPVGHAGSGIGRSETADSPDTSLWSCQCMNDEQCCFKTTDLRPGVGAGQVPGLLIFCVSNRMPNSWFLRMARTVNKAW